MIDESQEPFKNQKAKKTSPRRTNSSAHTRPRHHRLREGKPMRKKYLGQKGKHGRDVVPVEVRRDESPRTAPRLPLFEKHGALHPDLLRGPRDHVLQHPKSKCECKLHAPSSEGVTVRCESEQRHGTYHQETPEYTAEITVFTSVGRTGTVCCAFIGRLSSYSS